MDHREVDVGLRDLVDLGGQRVQRDVERDLEGFGIAVAGPADVLPRLFADVVALARHQTRAANFTAASALGSLEAAVAVRGDLGVIELGEVF